MKRRLQFTTPDLTQRESATDTPLPSPATDLERRLLGALSGLSRQLTQYDVKPEPGDLIEIFRGSYQHWAVYIGDGFVVHLAPPSEVPGAGVNSVMSVFCENAYVKRAELWDVVGTHKWQINNILDDQYEPRPAHVVVREARALVGTKMSYCVFQRNCEHFATELRYGKAQSRQVRKAGEVVMAAGVAGVVVVGLVALAGVFFGGGSKEKKNTQ